MPLQFSVFNTNHPHYVQSLALRERILRLPLGRILNQQDLADESTHTHFALFDEHQIIACLILRPISDQIVKLRQMAVAQPYQSQGMGRKLIANAEQWACSQHYQHIHTDARLTAQGFYASLGYQPQGEPFEHIGITHIAMAKPITTS